MTEPKVADLSPQKLDAQFFKVMSNVKQNADGSLTIGDSTDVPKVYGDAKRYAYLATIDLKAPDKFQTAIIAVNGQ